MARLARSLAPALPACVQLTTEQTKLDLEVGWVFRMELEAAALEILREATVLFKGVSQWQTVTHQPAALLPALAEW